MFCYCSRRHQNPGRTMVLRTKKELSEPHAASSRSSSAVPLGRLCWWEDTVVMPHIGRPLLSLPPDRLVVLSPRRYCPGLPRPRVKVGEVRGEMPALVLCPLVRLPAPRVSLVMSSQGQGPSGFFRVVHTGMGNSGDTATGRRQRSAEGMSLRGADIRRVATYDALHERRSPTYRQRLRVA
jgi:hypothetical protein